MKPNEAPKKVYLHLTTGCRSLNGKYNEYKPAKIRIDDKIIEYTRTDAFIEKAIKFFTPYIQDNSGGYDRANVIDDFKNYIKGE